MKAEDSVKWRLIKKQGFRNIISGSLFFTAAVRTAALLPFFPEVHEFYLSDS